MSIRRRAVTALGVATLMIAAAVGAGTAGPAAATASGRVTVSAACAAAAPGQARCFAQVRTDPSARSAAARADAMAAAPAGYGPAQLASAYHLTGSGAHPTIGIVDAFDDPAAKSDLATYRARYGLPACTQGSGCFRKITQSGHTTGFPPADNGWAVETSLDLDMVSAACPGCKILLVEADDNSLDSLAAAVDTAVRQGAAVVTNSYGTDEFNGMTTLFKHYQHPGHPIVVSSGDYGFTAAAFPAVTPGALAVGGTDLEAAKGTARGWTETAWEDASSGCSAYVAKPSWQHDTHCGMRTIADVSAVASPDPGLAVYDSTPDPYGDPPGWLTVGGTSASSPFVAGLIGRAGNASTFTPARIYAHAADLNDVVGGSNGYCGGDYLCTGKAGYDGPTGVGTPKGLGAF